MISFARTCASIAATPSKLEKVALVSAYLRGLDDADLAAATRFFTGNPFAQRDQKRLSIGGRTIVEAAKAVWGITDSQLSAAYRAHGDLGEALGPLMREALSPELFREALTPASLARSFEEIARASGKAAGRRRLHLCERMLAACTSPLEATYAVKIVTGDLRIGLKQGLIHEAIALAFAQPLAAIRRAVMTSGDVGDVAVAAKHGRLDELQVRFGSPIGFMLASPVPYGDHYPDVENHAWLTEDKYDGIRAQAHVFDGRAMLYSRAMNDVSRSYPEIAEALAMQPRRMILDGEIVAARNGRILPFRTLQARLARKEIGAELLADVPLQFIVFDVLAVEDDLLLDEPLSSRRTRLADALRPNETIVLAPSAALESSPSPQEVNARFDASRERGNEGLMLKRLDAPYVPGRRGKWWLKLKRELATLDVVVVAVEWGHGKRAKVLSDYTFAVQDSGELLTIGKAYSGLTDAEIATLTPWFLEHRLPTEHRREKARSGEIPVEPAVVLEIAFDIIQQSELHESGFALRFPRIVRIRDDKPASEIDTIERVRELYAQMLNREGIGTIQGAEQRSTSADEQSR
jgi:DNA ligase 1